MAARKAGSTYFDLSEERENEILSLYDSLTERLNDILNQQNAELVEICRESAYEPLLNMVNETKGIFAGEVRNKAAEILEGWTEGEASFTGAAENSQAGEAAMETAKYIQRQIEEKFNDFWEGTPFKESIEEDTSRPNIKDEHFESLKTVYKAMSDEIGQAGNDAVTKLDNPTCRLLIPALQALTEPMKQAFEDCIEKIERAKEAIEQIKSDQDSANEEASQEAVSQATAEDYAEAVEMFKDI